MMPNSIERAASKASSIAASVKESALAAPSGRRGSKGGFSSTATSIASSDNLGDGASDVRSTGDGTLDKFRSRASDDGHSGQSEGSPHHRSISKLFKKGRRRRKSLAPDDSSPPGDAVEDMPPLPDKRPQQSTEDRHHSEESLALAKSIPSSLLTEDSDTEDSPVRPSISQHNSHAGYLTLSSPLIASETIDSTITSDTNLADSATSAEEAAAPNRSNTSIASQDIRRNASPVGKLKDAFSPQRRSTSPRTATNTDNSRPSTSGGGLGVLFGGKQRVPRILDDTAVLHASPPQIHDSPAAHSTPNLPATSLKRIVTQGPGTPPNVGDTLTTFVTPPTPTDVRPPSPTGSTASSKAAAKHVTSQSNPNVVVHPSGNMISHRRTRSATNPPSKLSHASFPVLTPMVEEAKTPGGTAFSPQSTSGFFSSVFSAAQNAANSLGTTIANSTAGNKNKIGNQQASADEKRTGDAGGEEVIGPENADTSADNTEKRRLAVETLGSGDLSLEQLGITDASDPSPRASVVTASRMGDEASAKAEDIAASQAISAAYAGEQHASVVTDRPRSLTTASGASGAAGAASPPRQQELTDSPAPSSVQRQGSIRSRISGSRRRRHRGSSATTGNTIAAAIGASTTTLAPQAALNGNRLNGTGFAVASPKRNRDFHNLFKSVPEDDYLIEDYSAALQKEILLQGRLYVSEGHLCFSSNILGWVTNLVISFDEVVSVEKKSTAVLFPNGIVIQTLHARNIFASFLSRDSTYDLIIGIWKISHPNLKSSLNGVTLDGSAGTGDKTEKAESIGSDDESIQDSDDEVYDEDAEEEEGMGSFTEAGEGSAVGSELGSERGVESRKASAVVAQAIGGGAGKLPESAETAANGTSAAQDFPGPATHSPTDCGDADSHYDKLLIDTTIPAPLGKVYSMLFGPTSGAFMRKWLIDDQKSTDLQMEDDKKGLGEERKTFSFSYIKPLPGSIGPRQTKCNIDMSLEQFDLEKAVTVLCSTQTPDVPSGNSFLTKTRYCLCWGPANSTRLIMTFTVEWSGKSWLKGPIEKGANDGQLSYATALATSLRAAVAAKAVSRTPGKGRNGKKRSKAQSPDETERTPATASTSAPAQVKAANWGLFEPVRPVLSPVADILGGLFDSKILTSLLLILLVWSYFFRSPTSSPSSLSHPHTPAERIAAYEQIWRTEEAELWKWMEERVALDRVHDAAGARVRQAVDMQDRLVDERVGERVVDEAIRVTEERLEGLKRAVRRERERGRGKEKEKGKQ